MNEKYKDKLKEDLAWLKKLRYHSQLKEPMYSSTQKERDLEKELYDIEQAEKIERNKYCRDFSVEVDGY